MNIDSYIAGYIEGDGYIGIPKYQGEKFKSGRIKYPTIQISFPTKDLPIAQIFLKKIGTGSLLKKKGVNAYILTFNKKESILKIIETIRNYMRTPKINSLNELINYYKLEEPAILSKTQLTQDAWLAGFIDADGSFQIRSTSKTDKRKYDRLTCSFELSQINMDKSGDSLNEILKEIGKFLETEVKLTRRNELRIKTGSLKSNKILREYLDRNPILTSKYLDYLDWSRVLKIIEEKKHKTEGGKKEIINYKSKMNNKRIEYNWNHLTYIWEKLI